MFTLKNNSRGFTLIELLVVITIIGILATGATTVYTSQIQKARDTTRINDVKALQSAVEQVYQDGGEYPHSDTFLTGASAGKVGVSTYMPKLPRDPKDGQKCNNGGTGSGVSTGCVYAYQTGSDDNGIDYGIYVLSTGFESLGKTQSDATRDGGKLTYRWEAGNGILGTNALTVDVTDANCTDGKKISSTTKGILGKDCSSAPATGTDLITIHGS